MAEVFCPECLKPLESDDDDYYCGHCGCKFEIKKYSEK